MGDWRGNGAFARQFALHERRHLLHTGLRRRHAAHRDGQVDRRCGGGIRVRPAGRRHRLSAGALPAVLATRGADHPPRRAGRLPPDCRHPARALCRGAAPRRDRRAPRGMGVVGGRAAGESPVLSDARVLSLATARRVVARCAHRDDGHLRARAHRLPRREHLPGARDLRHDTPRIDGHRESVRARRAGRRDSGPGSRATQRYRVRTAADAPVVRRAGVQRDDEWSKLGRARHRDIDGSAIPRVASG